MNRYQTMNAIAFLLSLTTSITLAQGPLAPPGAPAPTMKTLDQIEARIPIPKSPSVPIAGPHLVISQPGSYYLTGNVQVASGNGIDIQASNVTLDLNGFTLLCTSATDGGIAINIVGSVSSIEIKNGRIAGGTVRTFSGPREWEATFSGAGWSSGITSGSTSQNFLLSRLTVERCSGRGIFLGGSGHTLKQISANSNGNSGIVAGIYASVSNSNSSSNSGSGFEADSGTVTNCSANSNRLNGFFAPDATITNSTATNNGGGGISANNGNISNCTGNFNRFFGIAALSGSISNSTAKSNTTNGIEAREGSVSNCKSSLNGGAGISADSGSVSNSTASSNAGNGITATLGSVHTVTATSNNGHGIKADNGSVTNSTASLNGSRGIESVSGNVTSSRANANFKSGIFVGIGVAAHCSASGNSTDTATVDKQIDVTAGGQRIGCVPVSE